MSRASSIVVVSAADAPYACPLAVLLHSVQARLPADRRVEFHVIDAGLGPELRSKVAAGIDSPRASIHWVVPERSPFIGLPLWGRMTMATYDKLQVPQLLPASVGKALWLDADILAHENVAELWDRDLGDQSALAVPDSLVPRLSAPFGVAGWRALGLDPASAYFNAGVMLMNLDHWRREAVTRRAVDYLRQHHAGVYFWDQEALNAVLAGHWGRLEPRWNWSPGLATRDEPAPALVHFTGNLKPWQHLGRTPWHARYYEQIDQTAWRGCRPACPRGGLVAWYEASPLRPMLRRLEPWGMRLWRRRTFRPATAADLQLAPEGTASNHDSAASALSPIQKSPP